MSPPRIEMTDVVSMAALSLMAIAVIGCRSEKTPNGSSNEQPPTAAIVTTFDGVGRARIGTPTSQLREIGAFPTATGARHAGR